MPVTCPSSSRATRSCTRCIALSDDILKSLEVELFLPALSEALTLAHEELERTARALGPALGDSARDVDVYLAVARSLLEGRGLPVEDARSNGVLGRLKELAAPNAGALSRLGHGDQVEELVQRVVAEAPGDPDARVVLYGGKRAVDFSQFRPRGHYTESPELGRYFRAMMWLGRSDTGFILAPADERSALVGRELGPRVDANDIADPKPRRIAELFALYRSAAPAERERLYREMKAVQSEAELRR